MNLPTATEKVIEAMVILEQMKSEELDEAYDILDQAARSLCESMGLDFTYIEQFARRKH